jgi:hypothetical protein
VQPFAADLFGPPPVGSAQWWKQPERFDASSDPDTATAQTVAVMCDHIKRGGGDPVVQEAAAQAVQQFGGSQITPGGIAAGAWYWCKTYIRFVHHELLLRRYLGEANHLQGLISPDALVRMDRPEGDCAIFTDCLCAFLRVFGVPYEIVTVAVNPNEPDIYSHVYAYAVLQDGTRLPLDASHGTYPGWQVPSSDVSRRQVWDADGNPVADRGSRFNGLNGYGLRGRGLGALVCDQDGVNCYDDGTVTPASTVVPSSDTVWTNPYGAGSAYPIATPVASLPPTATIAVPAQNTAAYAALASQLVKGGFTLADLNAMQPGTVINPNGQIIRQAPGYAVTSGGAVAVGNPLTSLASSSMLLPLLGVAAVALFAFGGKH